MGQSSFVNPVRVRPTQQAHKKTNAAVSKQGTMDWILIGVVIGMTLFGLLMVYSAGPKTAMSIGMPSDYFLQRQVYMGAGQPGSPRVFSAGLIITSTGV